MKYNAPGGRAGAAMRGGWRARPRWRLTRGARIALGPGKADLLEAIDRSGSISAAAADLGMSYRRAWLLVDVMNRCFARPLVATSPQRSRGAALTPSGRRVLTLYRRIERKSLAAARKEVAELCRSLLSRGSAVRRQPAGRTSRRR